MEIQSVAIFYIDVNKEFDRFGHQKTVLSCLDVDLLYEGDTSHASVIL